MPDHDPAWQQHDDDHEYASDYDDLQDDADEPDEHPINEGETS